MKSQTKMTLSERNKKHEEFKERLVEDVFGKNSEEKVQIEKVTMLIWQFRDDPRVVQFVAKFLTKYSGTRDVFDGIEFYLPQLAHMIIHLEASWDEAILERFALIISQHSLHVALQLNWILQGAIEDYQPETVDGLPNPAYNPLFYTRCVKLLKNVERCVVYGKPRTHELKKMYEMGEITQEEYEELELADRNFNATQIMEVQFENGKSNVAEGLSEIDSTGGYLLYKRRVRRSALRRKNWKMRYFNVDNGILHCYNVHPEKGGKLVRAMPLEGAKVASINGGKYQYMFEIVNQSYVYQVRASNQEEKEKWMNLIGDESDCKSFLENTCSHQNADDGSTVASSLDPSQTARYEFFRGERNFVRSMCDIAEKLRFEEREERKKFAPGMMQQLHIPSCAYLPLCNSTDIWRRIDKTVHNETRVFNTNERCPTLMYFISKRGEDKSPEIDVASYMYEHIQNYEEEKSDELHEYYEPREMHDIANNIAVEVGLRTVEENEELTVKTDKESESESVSLGLWHHGDGKYSRRALSVRGNKLVQKFLRENKLQVLPKTIQKTIEEKRAMSKRSKLDMATLPVQSVKIVDKTHSGNEGDQSVKNEYVEIDEESLKRAKEIVCGGETFAEKSKRMCSHAINEGLVEQNDSIIEIESVITKSNDDLRQEVFVMQMIHYYKSVFAKENLPIWLFTYRILSTSKTTGLIELIKDATSIDALKKSEKFPAKGGLKQYFIETYGQGTESFKTAQRNFMSSLVGYSLVSYLLGLKDRHNGNIMIDTKGHLIFIDFGFAMGMAPGHEFSFEKAPFKLVNDYMDVMGGPKSECFAEFKRLFVSGFEAARANAQVALGLVEIMMYKSNFPCFTGSRYGNGISLKRFESRLMLDVPDNKIKKKAQHLIDNAMNHTGTVLYDKFQHYSNGYIP